MTGSPYGNEMDCAPTLTDREVVDFCRNGYLMLPGVVPDDVNRQVIDYLDRVDSTYEPTPIMKESFFVDGVLMNPQAAGAVRSLLGSGFTLPLIISNHRGPLPFDQPQNWHRDGGTIYTDQLEYLQVFYYPEECTEDMGPTVVLPGSHFMRNKAPMMAHLGSIRGPYRRPVRPARSFSPSTGSGTAGRGPPRVREERASTATCSSTTTGGPYRRGETGSRKRTSTSTPSNSIRRRACSSSSRAPSRPRGCSPGSAARRTSTGKEADSAGPSPPPFGTA